MEAGLVPLVRALQDLAVWRPGTRLRKLRLGLEEPGWHTEEPLHAVGDLIDLVRRALRDPRLLSRAKAHLEGPNFYWTVDPSGLVAVMAREPGLDVDWPIFWEGEGRFPET